MGTTELALLLKYGVPVAVKLLADGKEESETVDAVTSAITNMDAGVPDVGEKLLKADEEQTKNIIDGLFGMITGLGGAFGGLVKAFVGLLGG